MEVETVISMNGGDGESSYANNSLVQKAVILKARPILDATIKDLFSTTIFPTCFRVADLGCSSGPNTLVAISEIVDIIHEICQQRNCKQPEYQVFLNDLPGNDFNSIFKSLPAFYERFKQDKEDKLGLCSMSGTPGSFYGRLFPSKSLNFVHSSNSVHWLSQVPEGLGNNKGHIYMAQSSPPSVFKAYMEQFSRDFSMFLKLRSEEIICGGRMALSFIGRNISDPTSKDCCNVWELLAKSLLDLVAEGLVEEADVDSFNMPYYTPSREEVKAIVQKEGSFNLDMLEIFELNEIGNQGFELNNYRIGQNVANSTRAVMEPMLASHFGDSIISTLFAKYANHVAEYLFVEKIKGYTIVISMTKT